MLPRLLIPGLWWLLAMAVRPALALDCTAIGPIPQAQREVLRGGQVIDQQTVALPDTLRREWRREGTTLRYSLDVSACASQAGRGLWFYRIGAPYHLHIDGAVVLPELPAIRHGSVPTTPPTFNGRTPMLYALPTGAREVRIETQTLPYLPVGIAKGWAGPMTDLLPEQVSGYSFHTGGMRVVSIITWVIGVGVVALWLARRQYRAVFWFGMMCVLWGVRGTFYASDTLSLPPLVFEQLNPYVVSLFAVACLQTTLLLLGRQTVRRSRALLVAAGFFTLAFAAAHWAGQGALAVRAVAFVFGLGMLAVMPLLLWSGREVIGRWQAGLMALGFVNLLGASVHDILIVLGWLPPDRISLITIGFSGLLLAYALVCADFVMRALNQAENSNEVLEARVREKSRELEHSYTLLRESERASARAQERARFNREIHDGLGAQLITALRGVERDALNKEQVLQTLQEGLDELRLLMDSSDLGRSLHGALVSWRNRWDARLQAIGLQLQWSVADDLDALELGSDATLQIMRVLQESVTNTLKHAGARNISIRAWRESGTVDALRLEIQDDGKGLPEQPAAASGRGLRHMVQRAEKLGARLVVANALAPQRGVLVSLRLPLPEGDFPSSDAAPLVA